MTQLKRWATMNRVFLIALGLMVIFAYMDYKQVTAIREIPLEGQAKWDIYWTHQQPATVIMWVAVFIAIGVIWYLFSKDKSEALALAITPMIMLWYGTQDLVYFMFDKGALQQCMEWATRVPPVRFISNFLGETCPSPTAFVLSGIIGIIIAYYVYRYLKKAKW